MWNLDNLDFDVTREHVVTSWFNQPVDVHTTSTHGRRILTTNKPFAEARVYDLDSGDWEFTLEHSHQPELQILDVVVSKYGSFCATRSYTDVEHIEDTPVSWPLLRDDKIWSLESGKMVYSTYGSRFVTFSPAEDKVVFTVCQQFDNGDRHGVGYSLEVLPLNNGYDQAWTVELPAGEIIGEPVITESGKYLAIVLQTRKPLTQDGPVEHVRNHWSSTLLLYSFEVMWHGLRYLHLPQLWSGYPTDSGVIDLRLFRDESFFLIYAHKFECFQHHADGQVDRNRLLRKGALIYDAAGDNVVRRLQEFVKTESSLDHLVFSQQLSFVMDQAGRVFNTIDNTCIFQLSLSGFDRNHSVFLLDGKYVALLTSNKQEVVLKRAADGKQIAHFYIHSKARWVRKVSDDRTLNISTEDGRLLTLMTTLGEADHVTSLTNQLSSRKKGCSEWTDKPWLSKDIFHTLKNDCLQMQMNELVNGAKQNGLMRVSSQKSLTSNGLTGRYRGEACRVQ